MFYFFSQFLEKEQRRGTLDSQPEAGGSLFKHIINMKGKRQNNKNNNSPKLYGAMTLKNSYILMVFLLAKLIVDVVL